MRIFHPAAIAASVCLVLVGLAAAKQHKPLRQAFASVLAGISALGAVNLLAGYTGVELSINFLSWFFAVALGVPGVICLLLLQVVFGAV